DPQRRFWIRMNDSKRIVILNSALKDQNGGVVGRRVPVHSTNRIFSLLTYKRIPIIGIYSNYPIFAATNEIFSLSHVSKIPTIGICSNYVSKLDGLDHAYSKGK